MTGALASFAPSFFPVYFVALLANSRVTFQWSLSFAKNAEVRADDLGPIV
jgi:hypothetical protein